LLLGGTQVVYVKTRVLISAWLRIDG